MGQSLPKEDTGSTSGDVSIDFGQQKFQISQELTLEKCLQLCTLLNLRPADVDKVERSASPSVALLQILEEREMYGDGNCELLYKALNTIGMQSLASKLHPCNNTLGRQSSTEKKRMLVDNLRIRYKDIYKYQCGVGPSERTFIDLHLTLSDPKKGRRADKQRIKLSSYLDIFTNPALRREMRIIIEGDAGFGKTTLAIQLAYLWSTATKNSPLRGIDILIFLQMSKVKHLRSLYEAIKGQLPVDCPLTVDDIREIIQRSSHSLIALDGWDEYVGKSLVDQKSDFFHIAQNQMLTQSRVIITTRPSCPAVRRYPASRLRIKELNDEQRQAYIREIYSDQPEIAKETISFIEENDFLRSLCGVPLLFQLFMNNVLDDVYREKDLSLNRVTALFQTVWKCFAHQRHRQRDSNTANPTHDLEDFESLCKIACDGLRSGSPETKWALGMFENFRCLKFWTDSGILVKEDEDTDSNGFLTSREDISRSFNLRFLHAMFQEWFAAQYLGKLVLENLDSFKDYLKLLNPVQLVNLFPFICGLEPSATYHVMEYLLSLKDEHPYPMMDFMFQCFHEYEGDKAHLGELIVRICRKPVSIYARNSRMLQNAKIELLTTASEYQIPISKVNLVGVVQAIDDEGAILKSGLRLPPLLTVESFVIIGYKHRRIPTCHDMLRYAAKSKSLERAWLYYKCWTLPSIINVVASLTLLEETKVFLFNGKKWFILDMNGGKWLKQVEGKAKRHALGDTFLLDTYVLD